MAVLTLAVLTACGRKVDGRLYDSAGGNALADREVVVVPATGKTRDALDDFCSNVVKHKASADSLRSTLEARSIQLAGEAAREEAGSGRSPKWRSLTNSSIATSDSARAVPLEGLSSSRDVARSLAVAKARTDSTGTYHFAKVPFGKHLIVATSDDDWSDVISVGLFKGTVADMSLDRAMPGCMLRKDFSR